MPEGMEEKNAIPARQPVPALRAAANFFYKIRTHIIILLLTAAYLVVAPEVYNSFFVKLGKPIYLKIDPPAASPLIYFNIEYSEDFVIEGQTLYQFTGWVFLENAPDQSLYKKYFVLNSKDRVYYFPYEETERKDVIKFFEDLGLDILNSGFRALLSPEIVQPGKYNIGFLFMNNSGDKTYYSASNRYFIRTPNTAAVETGELPDGSEIRINTTVNTSLTYGAGEQPGPFDFSDDKIVQFWLEDSHSDVSIGGRDYGRITGWAFLEDEEDQSAYFRWVMLESNRDTFYYPVKSIERSDIQKAFPGLVSRFTGFSVDVLKESLPLGTYRVSFLFQSRGQGPDYITSTPWFVTQTPSEFILEYK